MHEVEGKYLDVLQNIEFAIVQVYREKPELADWDVIRALETLLRGYKAEQIGHPPPTGNLRPLAQEVHDKVRSICEIRLGRAPIVAERERKVLGITFHKKSEVLIPSKTVSEIILCLKRIRKSVEFWNKRSGQRGYLNFISEIGGS